MVSDHVNWEGIAHFQSTVFPSDKIVFNINAGIKQMKKKLNETKCLWQLGI